MPQNKFQRTIFALLTVIVTVHAYVFYSVYVIHGEQMLSLTGAANVWAAVVQLGGIFMLGRVMPVWAVVLVEFVLAMLLETTMGSPCSFKLACKVFDPRATHPVLFETAIICATVGLMCPAMSFIAAFLYYPWQNGFNLAVVLSDWLKLVCFNFPFAFFTQLFFIQPLVRTVFKAIFVHEKQAQAA